MKKLILITLFFISVNSFCQSDWVTNLQMKGYTWKAIAPAYKSLGDSTSFSSFVRLFNTFKTKPNNHANVTLDSIPVTTVAFIYDFLLFNYGYDAPLADFKTSITPKRNTNPTLELLCQMIEGRYAALESDNITKGEKALGN